MWSVLRKFNLDHCDLPTMIWNVGVVLRVLTVNIDSKYNKDTSICYYLLVLVFAACYFYAYIISMIWFVFFRCRQTGDLVAAMIIFSLGICSEIGTVKLLYMIIYIDKIRETVNDFLQCDAQTVLGCRFQINLLKTLRFVKKRAILYWMVIVGNGLLYIVVPIFMPGRNLPENRQVLYGLEPTFESPNYEITYVTTSAGVIIICYVASAVSAYFILIAGYIESQMVALSEEVIQIWPDALKNAKEDSNYKLKANNEILVNKYVAKRLKEIIVRHGLLIKLFRKFENTFRAPIAIGFFFLIMGLVAELLGKLENTYMQMPFTFMQVAMDCFASQRLMDASILYAQAVYDCQWENFDKTNMKIVLVMLQSAQKTMTLSAGGMAMLNFSCLMTITSRIYSAYTTLRLQFNF